MDFSYLQECSERAHNQREGASWQMLGNNGVIIMLDANSSNTYIDKRATVGRGTKIYPGVEILGKTVIGTNCVIQGKTTKITDSIIRDGSIISDSIIVNSDTAGHVTIGPHSVIEKSSIGYAAQIGLSVILRRAKIGMRTKVPYHTQLADIEIGGDTNIARNVTISNFDGQSKKKTRIGYGCFIGTDVNINGGTWIGNEVRIHPKLFVASRDFIPNHSWITACRCQDKRHPWDLLKNRSFKIPGHWYWIYTRVPNKSLEAMKKVLGRIGITFTETEEMTEFLTRRDQTKHISFQKLLEATEDAAWFLSQLFHDSYYLKTPLDYALKYRTRSIPFLTPLIELQKQK